MPLRKLQKQLGTTYCTECEVRSTVTASREQADGNVWRRRECPLCGKRWTTWETTENPRNAGKITKEAREREGRKSDNR